MTNLFSHEIGKKIKIQVSANPNEQQTKITKLKSIRIPFTNKQNFKIVDMVKQRYFAEASEVDSLLKELKNYDEGSLLQKQIRTAKLWRLWRTYRKVVTLRFEEKEMKRKIAEVQTKIEEQKKYIARTYGQFIE